jgi:type IV secretory pathway TrbF-like protein
MAANTYVEARREWDERYADLVLGKRNWQIAAGGLLLLALILASGTVWLIRAEAATFPTSLKSTNSDTRSLYHNG